MHKIQDVNIKAALINLLFMVHPLRSRTGSAVVLHLHKCSGWGVPVASKFMHQAGKLYISTHRFLKEILKMVFKRHHKNALLQHVFLAAENVGKTPLFLCDSSGVTGFVCSGSEEGRSVAHAQQTHPCASLKTCNTTPLTKNTIFWLRFQL